MAIKIGGRRHYVYQQPAWLEIVTSDYGARFYFRDYKDAEAAEDVIQFLNEKRRESERRDSEKKGLSRRKTFK